jgi:hypothetical protein
MSRLLLPVLAALALLVGGLQPTLAVNADKARETSTTMGESGKEPPSEGARNSSGTKETSTNKGNSTNTNCAGCGSSGPGNK